MFDRSIKTLVNPLTVIPQVSACTGPYRVCVGRQELLHRCRDDAVFNTMPFNVIEDDSTYPEVLSAVANTDDPEIPIITLRSWVLGLTWAIVVPSLN